MAAGIFIRYAEPEDLPDLAELAGRIWRSHYPGIISEGQINYMLERGYALPVLEAELASGVAFPLLFQDGRLIGLASFGPTDTADTAKLHKLYLETALHGRGLGRLLLNWIEDEAAGRGFRRIMLQVNKQNEKAIAAYRRKGYRVLREAVVDIGGGYVMDDFIMRKDLPPRS